MVATNSVPLPDLSDLPGVSVRPAPERQWLDATYYDTPDLRLAARGGTLRHRTGDADPGWHLKTPTGRRDTRTESRMPSEETVPEAFAERIRAYTRGVPVVPVASVRTDRTVHRLTGPDGTVLAELVVDDLTGHDLAAAPGTGTGHDLTAAPDTATGHHLAASPGAGTAVRWREFSVELLAGDRKLLKRIGARLRDLGVGLGGAESALARVLGDRAAAVRPGPPSATASDAGSVVRAHLYRQAERLLAADAAVREDRPDSVRRMRVTARRLRSALRTFAPVVGREDAERLGGELRWLSGVLAPVRDLEVLEERLRDHVRRTPSELVLGPVAARLTRRFGPERAAARRRMLAELDTPRYFALLDALDALVASPPATEAARRPARRTLRPLVRKEHRRAVRRMDRAGRAAPERRDAAYHAARKAARRARYAAEAVTPLYGRDARRYAKRMHALQDLLGDRQDSVVTRERLRDLAVQAYAARENAFSYGLFHNAESTRATRLEADLPATQHRATRKKRITWLT